MSGFSRSQSLFVPTSCLGCAANGTSFAVPSRPETDLVLHGGDGVDGGEGKRGVHGMKPAPERRNATQALIEVAGNGLFLVCL
jgi:hypothetical protein